ncbi:MAG: hypothetical protein AAF798_16810, partial [Bacteroidota bacterium]
NSELYKLNASKVQLEIERKLFKLQLEVGLDQARAKWESIQQHFQEEIEMLHWLQKEDEAADKSLSGKYQNLKNSILRRSIDRLEKDLIR